MTMTQIKQEVLALDPHQRIQLVQDIWDSVTRESHAVRIPKAHKQVIDRRIAEHDGNPSSALSLAQAKNQIRKHRSLQHKTK